MLTGQPLHIAFATTVVGVGEGFWVINPDVVGIANPTGNPGQ